MTNKIMIIDDNETNVKFLNLALTKAGFKTDAILNPKYAFDVIKESKPFMILLDINMPEINGFQLCKMLKKDKETKDIPIIFISALTDVKYIAGGLSLGAVDYISKPFKPEEVIARVSVQMEIALANKKLRKTNEILQKQITEENIENSDMQQDLLYSLMQIKNGKENPKDYERIKSFYKFVISKIIEDSQYADEFDEEFLNNTIKTAINS